MSLNATSIFKRLELIDSRMAPSTVMGIGQMNWDFSFDFSFVCISRANGLER